MENYLNRITIDPKICNGKPIIRGIRISVKTVLEYFAAGENSESIIKAYPTLQKEDITACLQFASKVVDTSISSTNLVAS